MTSINSNAMSRGTKPILGRALRAKTAINDTRDFAIARALGNLAQLRKIGFGANRRLLSVQTAARDTLQEPSSMALIPCCTM